MTKKTLGELLEACEITDADLELAEDELQKRSGNSELFGEITSLQAMETLAEARSNQKFVRLFRELMPEKLGEKCPITMRQTFAELSFTKKKIEDYKKMQN